LQACQADTNRLLLIATDASGCPLGQIRFDRHPAPANHANTAEARVGLSVDRCARGRGLSAELVKLGFEAMENQWRAPTEAVAKVMRSNGTGNACFARAVFLSDTEAASSPNAEDGALVPSRITLVSDAGSWLNAHLPELIQALWRRGHALRWIHDPAELMDGDVCLLLSCGRILSAEKLSLHHHNLVVHGSALPKGQGWSPMTWQILEGATEIPLTLFAAAAELDAGPIYLQRKIKLVGDELVEEWRSLQAQATIALCLSWVDHYEDVTAAAKPQSGEPSHYCRRRPADSRLDPDRSIGQQFNLLRVVDNQRYPAFFEWRGRRYELHIQPASLRSS
jgi:hypothetical protein